MRELVFIVSVRGQAPRTAVCAPCTVRGPCGAGGGVEAEGDPWLCIPVVCKEGPREAWERVLNRVAMCGGLRVFSVCSPCGLRVAGKLSTVARCAVSRQERGGGLLRV